MSQNTLRSIVRWGGEEYKQLTVIMVMNVKRYLRGKNVFFCLFNELIYISLIVKVNESLKRNHWVYLRKLCPWCARDVKSHVSQNTNGEITSAMGSHTSFTIIEESMKGRDWQVSHYYSSRKLS